MFMNRNRLCSKQWFQTSKYYFLMRDMWISNMTNILIPVLRSLYCRNYRKRYHKEKSTRLLALPCLQLGSHCFFFTLGFLGIKSTNNSRNKLNIPEKTGMKLFEWTQIIMSATTPFAFAWNNFCRAACLQQSSKAPTYLWTCPLKQKQFCF